MTCSEDRVPGVTGRGRRIRQILPESLGGQVLIRLLRGICSGARIILLASSGSPSERAVRQPLVCTLVSPVAERDLSIVIEAALVNRPADETPKSAPPLIFCVDDDS